MIPLLPYRQPKILENMDEVVETLQKENIKNVMLVTDKSIRGLGLTKELEEKTIKANIKLTILDDIFPNPTTHIVEKGLKVNN